MGILIIDFVGIIPERIERNGAGAVWDGKVARITHTCPWCQGENKLAEVEAHNVNGAWRWTVSQPCLECCYDLARDTELDHFADDETRAQANEAGLRAWRQILAYKGALKVPQGAHLFDYDREVIRAQA